MDTVFSSRLPQEATQGKGDSVPAQVLIVDDDPQYCALLQEYLGPYSFEITVALNGAEGIEAALAGNFDIVLLDMFLPDMNGLEVLKAIRMKSSVSIVVLSAHNEETDRIVAFEIGADDYVPKAFSPRELLARLRAVLRRIAVTSSSQEEDGETEEGEVLTVGDITVNKRTMTAMRSGEPINLTNIEFQLLYRMAQEPGRVFSREQLLDLVRGRDFYAFDRSIDMHISSLRRKLNDDSRNPHYVRTVRGSGYSFIQPARS